MQALLAQAFGKASVVWVGATPAHRQQHIELAFDSGETLGRNFWGELRFFLGQKLVARSERYRPEVEAFGGADLPAATDKDLAILKDYAGAKHAADLDDRLKTKSKFQPLEKAWDKEVRGSDRRRRVGLRGPRRFDPGQRQAIGRRRGTERKDSHQKRNSR